MAVDSLRADLVIEDPGEEILLLFKIELEGDFFPMDLLGIPNHQISPNGVECPSMNARENESLRERRRRRTPVNAL